MIKISSGLGPQNAPAPVMGESDLYDLVAAASSANPFDGRTKQGRAFSDGAWAVMREFEKAIADAPVVFL